MTIKDLSASDVPSLGANSAPQATLSLIAITLLVYCPFLRSLGFYWDDWPVVWVYNTFGAAGLADYFAGNRPVAGWIFSHLFPVLGINPVDWHVLTVLLQCTASVTVFALIRTLWPRSTSAAWFTGALVLLFPGFTQQAIALTYLPHYLSFSLCILSLVSSVYAIRARRNYLGWLAISMTLAIASYAITEYFTGLELFRVLIIWSVLHSESGVSEYQTRLLRRVLYVWTPYLALWAAFVIWRSLISHVAASATYKDVGSGLRQIVQHPIHELLVRLSTGAHNVLNATIFSWSRPFTPQLLEGGIRSNLQGWVLTASILLICVWILRRLASQSESVEASTRQVVILAIGGLMVAGLPFLIPNLASEFTTTPSYNDRMTLPFALASSLLLAALVGGGTIARVVVIGVFALFQLHNQQSYRADWKLQKSIFWQLSERAPALEKGSGVFAAGLPLSLYKNHTAGMLDMLYEGPRQPSSLRYFVFDLDRMTGAGITGQNSGTLARGQPIIGTLRSYQFRGTTSRSIVLWISPGGIIRIVSSRYVNEILKCSAMCFNLADISDPDRLITDSGLPQIGPLFTIFGPSPSRDWAFFYQKAELNRQLSKWSAIVDLGDIVIKEGLEPTDASEWFPFIEGYARAGRVDVARALAARTLSAEPDAAVPMAALFQRALPDGHY
jgi:hypothetical protein